MGKSNFKERSPRSSSRQSRLLEDKAPVREPFVVLSFRDFDKNQGQNFEDWEEERLLAIALTRLSQVCQIPVSQAVSQQIIKVYTKVDFPPDSQFTHPKHVAPGVKWASMHIQGKECIIGHLEDNIFHIVFLDKDHLFWPSKKRNT